MESEIEELIERLVGDVALTGTYGFSEVQLEQAVQAFQDDRKGHIQRPEQRSDLVAYETPPIAATPDEDRLIARVWKLLAEHPGVVIRDAEHVDMTKAETSEPQPSATDDVHTEVTRTGLEHAGRRIFVTEKRMWQAIAGHRVDYKRIAPLYFDCLSIIAAHGPAGILQPQITRLTGQQKQSVPMRTDVLADKGYITKRTVLACGTKTSLLKLKKFADAATMAVAGRRPNAVLQDLSGSVIIDYDIWFEQTIQLLKQQPNQLLAIPDLRIGLDIHKKRYEYKCLMRCIRRMANVGCFRKCSAKVADGDAVLTSYAKLRCIQLMREPTAADRHAWSQKDSSIRHDVSGVTDDDGEEEGEGDSDDDVVAEFGDADDAGDGNLADECNGAVSEKEGSEPEGNDGKEDVDSQARRQIPRSYTVRSYPNRTTPRVLAKPRISPETDQEEFETGANATAERLVKAAEMRHVQAHSADAEGNRAENGEPATKRRRISSEALPDTVAPLPSGDHPSPQLAEVEAHILSKSWRGIYINPPGARDLKAQRYTSVGRPRNALIAVVKTARLEELACFTNDRSVDGTSAVEHNTQDAEVEVEVDRTLIPKRMRTKSTVVEEGMRDDPSQCRAEADVDQRPAQTLEAPQHDASSLTGDEAGPAAKEPTANIEVAGSLTVTPRNEQGMAHSNAQQPLTSTPNSARQADGRVPTYSRQYINAHPGELFHHVGGGRWRRGAPPMKEQGSSLFLSKVGAAETSSVAGSEMRVPEDTTLVPQQRQQEETPAKATNASNQDTVGADTFRRDYVDSHPDEVFYHCGHGVWRRGRRPDRRRSTITKVEMPAATAPDQQSQTAPITEGLGMAETFRKKYVDAHPGETFVHCGNGYWTRGQSSGGRQSKAAIVEAADVQQQQPASSNTTIEPDRGTVVAETFSRDYVEAHPDEAFYHRGNGVWRRGEKPNKTRPATSSSEKDASSPLPIMPSQVTAEPLDMPAPPGDVKGHTAPDLPAGPPPETHSQEMHLPPGTPVAPSVETESHPDKTTYDAAYVKARKSEVFHHVGGGRWRKGPRSEVPIAHSAALQIPPAGSNAATVATATQVPFLQLLPKKRGRPTKAMLAERERLQGEAQHSVKRSLIVKLKVPDLGSSAKEPRVATQARNTSAGQPQTPVPFALAIVRPYYESADISANDSAGVAAMDSPDGTAAHVPEMSEQDATLADHLDPRTAHSDTEMLDADTVADTALTTPATRKRRASPMPSLHSDKRRQRPDAKPRIRTSKDGSVPHQRTSIILDIMEQCGGVFPGNKEMMYPFMTAWLKLYKQTPDRRTIEAAVKGLVDTGKLRKLTFSFRTSKGMNATSGILTLPSIQSSSVLVEEVKEGIVDAHPLPYLPAEVEVSDDLRPNSSNFPVPRGRKTSPDTWVLPDGTVTTTAPKHYTRDEFPPVEEDLAVQRTQEAIDLKDQEARALGFKDARSRAAEKGRANVKRWYYRHHPGAGVRGDFQEGSDDDYLGGDAPRNPAKFSQSFKVGRRSDWGMRMSLKRVGQSFHVPSGTFGTNGVWPPKLQKPAFTVPKAPKDEPKRKGLTKATQAVVFHSPSGTFGTHGAWPPKVRKSAFTVRKAPNDDSKRFSFTNATQAPLGEVMNMPHSLDDTPKKASRFGRTLTGTSRPLDHQFVGMEQAGFWETATAGDDGNMFNTPASPIADRTFDFQAEDRDAIFIQKPQTGRSKLESFDKAYVLAHPDEVFHHVGRARYRRGPQPPRAPKVQLSPGPATPSIAQYAISVNTATGAARNTDTPLPGLVTPAAFATTYASGQGESPFSAFPATAQPPESAAKPKRKYKSRKRKADAEDLGDAAPDTAQSQLGPSTKPRQLNITEVDDLIAALALVKVLCGGVAEQRLEWGLVSHALSFRYEEEALKLHWKRHARNRSCDVDRVQASIREPFLSAYEHGELPRIDFQDLGNTDWPALLLWAKTQGPLVLLGSVKKKASPGLPESTAVMHARYAMAESNGGIQSDDEVYFTAKTDDTRESAALRTLQGSALAVQEPEQPVNEDLTLLKSWCRAIAMTKGGSYNPREAAAKIGVFRNALIQKATDELLACRILTVERKDRQLPGRNYHLSRSTLKHFRRWPGEDGTFLQSVAVAHMDLLSHFDYNDTLELGHHAQESEILVLTNMVAQGQLRVETILPERNDDFDAPFPKLSAWGIGDADNLYNFHEHDPSRVQFPVIYHKTAGFSPAHGLRAVPIPLSSAPVQEEQGSRIPFWVDIHGNLIDDLWDMTLRSLLHLVVYRTGITAAGMEKAHDGKLWEWEIRIALSWMEEVGLAVRFGPGREVEGLWNGGWRAGEWWYCAFMPDIATWHVPMGKAV
ncbi:hypothetical protein LTR85_008795 [Meristemomyces frigidus]|nr:hypothetical protein LTR85_008795 [Meristemomyces frigidus]